MKLEIELVPCSSWGQNARSAVTKDVWDVLRKECYRAAGYHCEICGASGRLSAHEVWEYEDISQYPQGYPYCVQKLIRLIALCDMCHHVKHIGLARVLDREGKLKIEDVINHFMKVNECSLEEFKEHEQEAFKLHGRRSMYGWKLDLTVIGDLW